MRAENGEGSRVIGVHDDDQADILTFTCTETPEPAVAEEAAEAVGVRYDPTSRRAPPQRVDDGPHDHREGAVMIQSSMKRVENTPEVARTSSSGFRSRASPSRWCTQGVACQGETGSRAEMSLAQQWIAG